MQIYIEFDNLSQKLSNDLGHIIILRLKDILDNQKPQMFLLHPGF